MTLKIPPLVLLLVSALLMWVLDRFIPLATASIPGAMPVALLLAVTGIAVCTLGVVSFRRAGTTVNPLEPRSASRLVATGIYRHSRNPMYLGFLLLLLAWGVLLASLGALLVVPAFVVYMNRFQIAPEEHALTSLFGQNYARYREAVRRWI